MSKEQKKEDTVELTETKKETTRTNPVCMMPLYKEDIKSLDYEGKKNGEIRTLIRETLDLPKRVRTTGQMAIIREKLGLNVDAKPNEVNKALKKAFIESN